MNRSIIAKSVACGLNRVLVTDLHIHDDKFDFHLVARIDKSGYMSGAKFEPTYVEPTVVYDLKVEDRTTDHMHFCTEFAIPRFPSESVDPNYQTPESIQLQVRDVSAYCEVESIRRLMGYVFRSCVASSNFGAAMLTLDCGFVEAQGDATMDVVTNAHAVAEGAQDQHIRLTYEVKEGLVRVRRKVLHIQLDDVTRQTEILPVVEQITKEFQASTVQRGDWHKPDHFRLEAMANLLCKWRDEEPASYATEPRPDLPDSKEIPLYFRELMDRLPWHGQVRWLERALAEHNCPVEYLLIGPYEAFVLGNVVVIFSHLVDSVTPQVGNYLTPSKPASYASAYETRVGTFVEVVGNMVYRGATGYLTVNPKLCFQKINEGNRGGTILMGPDELYRAYGDLPKGTDNVWIAKALCTYGVDAKAVEVDGMSCVRVGDCTLVF